MANVLKILTGDAQELVSIAQPVTAIDDHIKTIIADMQATLADFRERSGFGRAMAAPQVGIGLRIIVLQLGGQPFTMINPQVIWRSGDMQELWDDCLSLPAVVVKVLRHMSISVRWQDEYGRQRHWHKLSPDLAELVQHEIDHLDGMLMTRRALGGEAIRPISERRRLIGNQQPAHRLSLDHIRLASATLDPMFLHTPQYECPPLSAKLGCHVTLKIETMNPLRCFKGRGAGFIIARAAARDESRQLVCASAGNWGLALAYHCARHALPLTVFAALNANPTKIAAINYYGADIRQVGHDFDSAKTQAKAYCETIGGWFIEDGYEPEISEGAGSIAVELLAAGQHYDAVYIPVGNGALISGMARWLKASSPDTRIIGVCPRGADAMQRSWLSHQVINGERVCTKADGLAVRVPVPEALRDMWGLVDDMILVDEGEIALAVHYALKYAGLILEPSGAAALAGIRSAAPAQGAESRVAAILTGANLSEVLTYPTLEPEEK
jgi:peptide deformylase